MKLLENSKMARPLELMAYMYISGVVEVGRN